MKKELYRIFITGILLGSSFFLISKLIFSGVDADLEENDSEQIIANYLEPPDRKEALISVDPIFGKMLNGTDPQRVHIYEVGDDIRPDLYEVYYFPEVVTNGTQGHYEVYRTLGKDRID